MRRFPFVRTLAASLSLVYFLTNCVLAHAPESNFWAERRRQKTLMAKLPAASSAVNVLQQLPALQKQMAVSSPLPQTPSTGAADSFLNALPYAYGTVRKVSGPARAKKIVIHIQDVHQNAEAQTNIAQALQELIQQKKIGLIALEGATEPIDLGGFRAFPNQESVRQAADFLLKENKISGPVHAAFTSPAALPPVIGVDDPAHYQANVDAYKRSAPLMAEEKQKLSALKLDLAKAKSEAYAPELKAFDEKVEAYREGKIQLGDYMQALSRAGPASPQMGRFQKALELESSLDFKRVETERAAIIEQLVRKLDPNQTTALINQSLAYRLGKIRHKDFYGFLKDLCRRHEIHLSPALDGYIQYVLLADAIDAEALFQEAQAAEKKIFGSLARTPEEKRLTRDSKRLHLTGKLLDFSLNREEWEEYRELGKNPDLAAFESFYDEAMARDGAMAQNLLDAFERVSGEPRAAVLVTGGFHAQGLADRLQEAGISIVSFVPKITKVDAASGAAYLSVFSQEKTPLEKLFNGEKLFLAKIPLTFPIKQEAAVRVTAREQWLRKGGLNSAEVRGLIEGLLRDSPNDALRNVRDVRLITKDDGAVYLDVDGRLADLALIGANGEQLAERPALKPRPSWLRRAGRIIAELEYTVPMALLFFSEFPRKAFVFLGHDNRTLDEIVKRAIGARQIVLWTWIGILLGVSLAYFTGGYSLLLGPAFHVAVHIQHNGLIPEGALMAEPTDGGPFDDAAKLRALANAGNGEKASQGRVIEKIRGAYKALERRPGTFNIGLLGRELVAFKTGLLQKIFPTPDGGKLGKQWSFGGGYDLEDVRLTVKRKRNGPLTLLFNYRKKWTWRETPEPAVVYWEDGEFLTPQDRIIKKLREAYKALERNPGTFDIGSVGRELVELDGGALQITFPTPDGGKLGKPWGFGAGHDLESVRLTVKRDPGGPLTLVFHYTKKGKKVPGTAVVYWEDGRFMTSQDRTIKKIRDAYETLEKASEGTIEIGSLGQDLIRHDKGQMQINFPTPDGGKLGKQWSFGIGYNLSAVRLTLKREKGGPLTLLFYYRKIGAKEEAPEPVVLVWNAEERRFMKARETTRASTVRRIAQAVSGWLWGAVDIVRGWAGRPPLSLEFKARHAFWVEEAVFAWALPVALRWLFAVFGFVDPLWLLGVPLSPGFFAHLISNVLFGLSHDRLYFRGADGAVIDGGPARWRDRLGFALYGTLFRSAHFFPGLLNSGWAALISSFSHYFYNAVFAPRFGRPLAATGNGNGSGARRFRPRGWKHSVEFTPRFVSGVESAQKEHLNLLPDALERLRKVLPDPERVATPIRKTGRRAWRMHVGSGSRLHFSFLEENGEIILRLGAFDAKQASLGKRVGRRLFDADYLENVAAELENEAALVPVSGLSSSVLSCFKTVASPTGLAEDIINHFEELRTPLEKTVLKSLRPNTADASSAINVINTVRLLHYGEGSRKSLDSAWEGIFGHLERTGEPEAAARAIIAGQDLTEEEFDRIRRLVKIAYDIRIELAKLIARVFESGKPIPSADLRALLERVPSSVLRQVLERRLMDWGSRLMRDAAAVSDDEMREAKAKVAELLASVLALDAAQRDERINAIFNQAMAEIEKAAKAPASAGPAPAAPGPQVKVVAAPAAPARPQAPDRAAIKAEKKKRAAEEKQRLKNSLKKKQPGLYQRLWNQVRSRGAHYLHVAGMTFGVFVIVVALFTILGHRLSVKSPRTGAAYFQMAPDRQIEVPFNDTAFWNALAERWMASGDGTERELGDLLRRVNADDRLVLENDPSVLALTYRSSRPGDATSRDYPSGEYLIPTLEYDQAAVNELVRRAALAGGEKDGILLEAMTREVLTLALDVQKNAARNAESYQTLESYLQQIRQSGVDVTFSPMADLVEYEALVVTGRLAEAWTAFYRHCSGGPIRVTEADLLGWSRDPSHPLAKAAGTWLRNRAEILGALAEHPERPKWRAALLIMKKILAGETNTSEESIRILREAYDMEKRRLGLKTDAQDPSRVLGRPPRDFLPLLNGPLPSADDLERDFENKSFYQTPADAKLGERVTAALHELRKGLKAMGKDPQAMGLNVKDDLNAVKLHSLFGGRELSDQEKRVLLRFREDLESAYARYENDVAPYWARISKEGRRISQRDLESNKLFLPFLDALIRGGGGETSPAPSPSRPSEPAAPPSEAAPRDGSALEASSGSGFFGPLLFGVSMILRGKKSEEPSLETDVESFKKEILEGIPPLPGGPALRHLVQDVEFLNQTRTLLTAKLKIPGNDAILNILSYGDKILLLSFGRIPDDRLRQRYFEEIRRVVLRWLQKRGFRKDVQFRLDHEGFPKDDVLLKNMFMKYAKNKGSTPYRIEATEESRYLILDLGALDLEPAAPRNFSSMAYSLRALALGLGLLTVSSPLAAATGIFGMFLAGVVLISLSRTVREAAKMARAKLFERSSRTRETARAPGAPVPAADWLGPLRRGLESLSAVKNRFMETEKKALNFFLAVSLIVSLPFWCAALLLTIPARGARWSKNLDHIEQLLENAEERNVPKKRIAAWMIEAEDGESLFNVLKANKLLPSGLRYHPDRFQEFGRELWDEIVGDEAARYYDSSPLVGSLHIPSQRVKLQGKTFHIVGGDHDKEDESPLPEMLERVQTLVSRAREIGSPVYFESNLKKHFKSPYGEELDDQEMLSLWDHFRFILQSTSDELELGFDTAFNGGYLPGYLMSAFVYKKVVLGRSEYMAERVSRYDGPASDVVLIVGALHVDQVRRALERKARLLGKPAKKGGKQPRRSNDEIYFQKAGHLNPREAAYMKWLVGELAVTGLDRLWVRSAANALVRMTPESLERLARTGLLTPEERDAVKDRRTFETAGLARRTIQEVREYVALGFTKPQRRTLISKLFSSKLLKRMKKRYGLSNNEVMLVVRNQGDPLGWLQKNFKEVLGLQKRLLVTRRQALQTQLFKKDGIEDVGRSKRDSPFLRWLWSAVEWARVRFLGEPSNARKTARALVAALALLQGATGDAEALAAEVGRIASKAAPLQVRSLDGRGLLDQAAALLDEEEFREALREELQQIPAAVRERLQSEPQVRLWLRDLAGYSDAPLNISDDVAGNTLILLDESLSDSRRDAQVAAALERKGRVFVAASTPELAEEFKKRYPGIPILKGGELAFEMLPDGAGRRILLRRLDNILFGNDFLRRGLWRVVGPNIPMDSSGLPANSPLRRAVFLLTDVPLRLMELENIDRIARLIAQQA